METLCRVLTLKNPDTWETFVRSCSTRMRPPSAVHMTDNFTFVEFGGNLIGGLYYNSPGQNCGPSK